MKKNALSKLMPGMMLWLGVSAAALAAPSTSRPVRIPVSADSQVHVALSNTNPNMLVVPGDRITAVDAASGMFLNEDKAAGQKNGSVLLMTAQTKPFTFYIRTEGGLSISVVGVPQHRQGRVLQFISDIHAFTGEAKSCRKAAAGFSNCCKDGGWGQSAGLAKCNTEEKEIGKAKEKKLSVYVGSYCSRKVLGVCLQRKEGYCVFESKLARIIQEQGRRDQLRISFGSGSSPKCRGLTIDELQRVRFDQINFSDFYSDLENGTTLPADDVLLDRIEQQVTSKMEER